MPLPTKRNSLIPVPRTWSSRRWFLTGFVAVVAAGIAKVAIADHFNK